MIIPADAPPWAHELADLLAQRATNAPLGLPRCTRLDLPAPARHRGALIYVGDATGGATPAFSDGSAWRRCDDRTIVT